MTLRLYPAGPGFQRICLLALLAGLMLACDPGQSIGARSESDRPLLMRVVEGADRRVYEVPAGARVHLETTLGPASDVDVALLADDCALIAEAVLPAVPYVIVVIARDETMTFIPTDPPRSYTDPAATETGKCGGRPPPQE